MSIGPILRRKYMDLHVPRVSDKERLLLIGTVQKVEADLLKDKGYDVVRADLFPRDSKIVKMDLTAPPEEYAGSADALVAFDVLEHISDDKAAVAGVLRLLKPGGQAYLHIPGGDVKAPLDECDQREGHVRHGYNEEQAKALIFTQPFADITYIKTFPPHMHQAIQVGLKEGNAAGMAMLERASFESDEKGSHHLFILTK